MPEIIDSFQPRTWPLSFLLQAIVQAEKLGTDVGQLPLVVELKVNGFEVPFSPVIDNLFSRMGEDYEKDVLAKAKELVGTVGLDKLRKALETAEHTIAERLEESLSAVLQAPAGTVEHPDDGELEAWRSTADDLLKFNQPSAYTLRRAAHLLQNAYLFATALREETQPSQGEGT